MADKTVVVTEDEAPPASPAADEAARAAAAAGQASDAATSAAALAEVQAARVTNAAANEIASFEGRLSEWQSKTEALAADLAADRSARETQFGETRSMLDGLTNSLQSIQSRLAPSPASPASPSPGPEPGALPAAQTAPAAPEPEPPRRKAHRWI